MDLRHLEQIVAICRCGGFSGAARSLGIAQPTLSRSIARLEAELSVTLFERQGGGARPTAHGAFVANRAEALLRAAATLGHDLQLLVQGQAGRLRIGVGPVTGLKPLPEVIRAAAAAFPRLQLETRHRGLRAVVKGLRNGRFDLVFCNSEIAEPYGDLIRIKIYEDRYVAAVRPGHPALDGGPLSPAQLLQFPLASFGQPPSLKEWLGVLSAEQQRNFLAFVSDDHELVKARPIGTDFVVRAPRFVVESELRDARLVELPLTWPMRYECWMLTTEAHWRLPVVKSIAEFAKAAAGPLGVADSLPG
jgi:DNA-binding transcriptional LysR family regulator